MASVTQPLRDEHKELLPLLERVKAAGDAVMQGRDFAAAVDAAYEFLSGHLIPHAKAEEAALYPAVGRVMHTADATRTMQVDHVEVGRLTDELGRLRQRLQTGSLTEAEQRDLCRVLYGLYTLVGVHFRKEEEVYLPLLDAGLSPEDAREMFEAMEGAAAEAKSGR